MSFSRNNSESENFTLINKSILLAFLETYENELKSRAGVLNSVKNGISSIFGKNNAYTTEKWVTKFKLDIEKLNTPQDLVKLISELGAFGESTESTSAYNHSECCKALHAARSYILSCFPEVDELIGNYVFDKRIIYDTEAEVNKLPIHPLKKAMIKSLIEKIKEHHLKREESQSKSYSLINPAKERGVMPGDEEKIEIEAKNTLNEDRELIYLGYRRHLPIKPDIIRLFPNYFYPTSEQKLKNNLLHVYAMVLQKNYHHVFVSEKYHDEAFESFEARLSLKKSSENISNPLEENENKIENTITTLKSPTHSNDTQGTSTTATVVTHIPSPKHSIVNLPETTPVAMTLETKNEEMAQSIATNASPIDQTIKLNTLAKANPAQAEKPAVSEPQKMFQNPLPKISKKTLKKEKIITPPTKHPSP